MSRLDVAFMGIGLKNPILAASGTFGFGTEYRDMFPPSIIGAVISKGLTLKPKDGNTGIRIWETGRGAIMNSIGLQNPGVPDFISRVLPVMNGLGTAVFVNLGGDSVEEYAEGAAMFEGVKVDAIEVNISCPNVHEGGMAFGVRADAAARVVSAVRRASTHRLMVKLSPNAESVTDVAKACEAEGADSVSLINTIQAMAVDVRTRRPVFDNVYAGMSGPAIFPVALRMVHQVSAAVGIPVSAAGGVCGWEDAVAMMLAGASTVQVGSAVFSDPLVYPRIIEGMEVYCEQEGISQISEIIGALR